VSDGKQKTEFDVGIGDMKLELRYSPDGQIIAIWDSDGALRLWRASDGELLGTLAGHVEGVNDVRFSPDGRTLFSSSSDGTIRLWGIP
jgi:WD40 repeat protein